MHPHFIDIDIDRICALIIIIVSVTTFVTDKIIKVGLVSPQRDARDKTAGKERRRADRSETSAGFTRVQRRRGRRRK